MKYFLLAALLLLCIPGVLGLADATFVMNNVPAQQTSIGDVYVYYPQVPILDGITIPIGTIIAYSTPGIVVNLDLENAPADAIVEQAGGDVNSEQAFYQREWVFPVTKGEEYIFSIESDGESIIRQRIVPDVRDRLVETEDIQPLERIITPTREDSIPLARDALNKYLGQDISVEEFMLTQEQGMKEVRVFKQKQTITRTYTDGETEVSTRVLIRIQPLIATADVNIIEVIPKTVAASVDDMVLDQNTIVLEEDPVIMWHITGNEIAEVSYELAGDQSITGNTIVVTNNFVAAEEKTNPWKIILPIALIPLVGILIFVFSKYEPKK